MAMVHVMGLTDTKKHRLIGESPKRFFAEVIGLLTFSFWR
jgi:hypothetical protein